MRFLIPVLAFVSIASLGQLALPALALAAQQPGGKLDVNIDINKGGGGGDWWANPVWIAIGVIALVLLIVIVAMSTRGGGTTVIKE
jgi:hypothetical protein